VDKKQLLSQSLAHVMVPALDKVRELVAKHPVHPGKLKQDGSPVTELDLALSLLLEEITQKHFPTAVVYSEENFFDWNFPLMAIDPLDGTREYIKNRPEWALSMGLFHDEKFQGEGWVFNPLKNELFETQKKRSFSVQGSYCGEVSHSEWEKGLFKNFSSPKFVLKPMGSIAYKLARLSKGECDFVVSLTPKNIWDVAGGSLLCESAGIHFYSAGKKVTKVQKQYQPPLIWCFDEIFSELSAHFGQTGKGL
jgi:myo-inositol-1(or 4)-monophosphatase